MSSIILQFLILGGTTFLGPEPVLEQKNECPARIEQPKEKLLLVQNMKQDAAKDLWSDMNAKRFMDNIKILSSDEYEGRGPATKGEELTVQFIAKQCQDIGLLPANNDSYYQNVPMIGIAENSAFPLILSDSSRKNQKALKYGADFVAWTRHQEAQVHIDGDLVFVGYGIEAPEYNWDDFKGVDVKDKILVMLVNDPPVRDPNDPSKLDEKTFKGKAMTYYGRWTYKFEMAAKKGAKGCLIIHQTEFAGYPWQVVQNSFVGEHFYLTSADCGMSWIPMEGWITYEKAKELFGMAGKDLDALLVAAVRRDFQPVDLNIKATLTLNNTIRAIESKNVVAKLPGSEPSLASECIVYSAHWDHLGMGPVKEGSPIYHGAIDNASGVAGLLEVAKALTAVEPKPKRSILFLFPTSEEKGLLGSQYYVEHPLSMKVVANINVDGLNLWGLTKDISILGLGESSIDEVLAEVAKVHKREVTPDPAPENGSYYRADHINFAKKRIPAIYSLVGANFINKHPGWGKEMLSKFYAADYHKPSDQWKAYFDVAGAMEDLKFLADVGYRIASDESAPKLKKESEFQKISFKN